MKKLFKLCLLVLVLSNILSSSANAHMREEWNTWIFEPYFGVDLGGRNLDWTTGYGNDFFNDGYAYADGFFGVQLNKYFALEVGFGHTLEGHHFANFPPATAILGLANPAPPALPKDEYSFVTESYIDGLLFNVVGCVPFAENTSLILLVGARNSNLHLRMLPIGDGPAPLKPVVAWESGSQLLPRIGLGIKRMVTKDFGAVFKVIWENTSKLDARLLVAGDTVIDILPPDVGVPSGTMADYFQAKPKSGFVYTVGFFWNLFDK